MSLPLPRLNLTEYRAIVGQLPPPSYDQIEAFADYVSSAKSWYKHLPLWPPGQPFLFYIDPHVGLDCIVDANGGAMYFPRTEETPQSHRFHYTWMTTEEYRARYGWLAFACNAGTQLMIPVVAERQDGKAVSGLLDNNPCRPTIHLTEDCGFQLPEEVVEAGTVCLTGVIHAFGSEPWIWLHHLQYEDHAIPWPEETGGTDTGVRIVNRCRVFAETKGRYFEEADEELHNLIEPERVRQRTEMAIAMLAVIDLVYGEAV